MEPRFNGFPAENVLAVNHSYTDSYHYHQPDPAPGNMVAQEDVLEDSDFDGTVLRYISQMLMEEDMEDQAFMLQESLHLQATERSLYEAIGEKYPPPPQLNLGYLNDPDETLDHEFLQNISGDDGGYLVNNRMVEAQGDYDVDIRKFQTCLAPVFSTPPSTYSSCNGLDESSNSTLHVPHLNGERQSGWLFSSGVEDATRLLPRENEFLIDFRVNNGSSIQEREEVAVKANKKKENELPRRRKNPNRDAVDLEDERSSKIPAVFPEFEKIVIHTPGEEGMKEFTEFRKSLKNGVERNGPRPKGSSGGKGRKRQNGKKEVVDLRALLMLCAQAVAADDHKSGNDLIKQIRQHSSPFGDGNQRLAHCFANALEARFAGTGSQIFKGLVRKTVLAADVLNAYYLFLAACPFRGVFNFVANMTARSVMFAANCRRLHVIDFGILYGFQWPTFIKKFSIIEGGPVKLRITGIEFPQPGFRPAQRVEETGRRLEGYAEKYRVHFEYNAIAKNWDDIQIEDLKIDNDETLVVTCLYRGENLNDESVRIESPRDVVLKLIRKINPDLFILGIVNGAYSAPFFLTRFREVLFHFSSIFDMLETIVPRENQQRMLLETQVFGREALNVIACEGWERVEKPETYKQWQARVMRSGFVQVPFDPGTVKKAIHRVQTDFHKDFLINQDKKWLLQGWKGRIIYALSAWKPTSKA